MAEEITITLAGEDGHVGVATLIEALENTLKVLRSLESRFPPQELLRWEIVRASMQSPLSITLAPRTRTARDEQTGRRIVRAYAHGIREISTGPSWPEYFDEDSLNAVKALVEDAKKDETQLTIFVPDEEPIVTLDSVVENVKQVVARTKTLHEVGTIEGWLEVASRHEKNSFFVWETLTRHKVECLAPPEQFKIAADYLANGVVRVAVTGRIKYRSGKPIFVQVEKVKKLREASELPQLGDLGKIDITGGLSSEEYIRRLRDGGR